MTKPARHVNDSASEACHMEGSTSSAASNPDLLMPDRPCRADCITAAPVGTVGFERPSPPAAVASPIVGSRSFPVVYNQRSQITHQQSSSLADSQSTTLLATIECDMPLATTHTTPPWQDFVWYLLRNCNIPTQYQLEGAQRVIEIILR